MSGACESIPIPTWLMSISIACEAKWTKTPQSRSSTRFAAWATYSNMSKLRTTAAWRIAILTALAYALGTAITFSIVYFFVAQGIRDRSDAWLSGEAAVLVRVSADTPRDRLYNRAVREVAELASRELPEERNAKGQNLNAVFFLEEDPNDQQGPLWV